MKRKFEIKIYHRSTGIDKAWVEVYADSFEDAKKETTCGVTKIIIIKE